MSNTTKKADSELKQKLDDAKAAADGFKGEIKKVQFEDYQFEVNTDLLDDVEIVEMIDSIENQNNMKVIVDFLNYLVGEDGYEKMKAHFVKKDGRFRLSKLSKIYTTIFENFDPKD